MGRWDGEPEREVGGKKYPPAGVSMTRACFTLAAKGKAQAPIFAGPEIQGRWRRRCFGEVIGRLRRGNKK